MNLSQWLKRRLWILFRREDVESDLSDEIRLHLDMETAELVRRGRTPEQARREARLLLGGVEQTKEAVRETRPLHWLGGMGLDVRLGLRVLRKSWGLTLLGGLAMVVVIGVCATAFVIFDTLRGSTLPLPEGDRIVRLAVIDRMRSGPVTSIQHFQFWCQALRSVENVAAFQTIERDLIAPDRSAGLVNLARMTASGFGVARVQPLMGRFFLEEDENPASPLVVVLGYDVWRFRFAGDPAAIGQTVRIGGEQHTVVGVMPADFGFPVNHHAWTPLRANSRDESVRVFGRLASGATVESAGAELASVGMEELSVPGQTSQLLVTRLSPYATSFLLLLPGPEPLIYALMPLLLSLLLIPPCANIAILIYARNVTRTQEFAARHVLGAGRGRIIGQLLMETLLLTACAGGVALVLTQKLLDWARAYASEDSELRNVVPYWMKPTLSLESILYVAGLVLLAAMIAGGIPALRATGRIAASGFQGLGVRTAGPRLGRTWTVLVALQVAFSMAVLPVAAHQVWAGLKGAIRGPGFEADRYLTAQLTMDEQRSSAQLRSLQAELVRQLRENTGVLSATLSPEIPGAEPVSMVEANVAGQEPFLARWNLVDDAFFDVFAIPLLTGRGFGPGDFNPGGPTVIVTHSFAKQFAGGASPLGRRIRETTPDRDPGPWFEIVGVVADIVTNEPVPTIYRAKPPGQNRKAMSLVLRIGAAIPNGLAAQLQEIATRLDPHLRVDQLRRLGDVYQEARRNENIASLALAVLVTIVLLFAAAGIYTLTAFAVTQRRREIAIRSAIGAPPKRLLAYILSRTLSPVVVGAAVGALFAGYLEIHLNANVDSGSSALRLAAGTGLLIAIGVLAVAGPAQRTLRVDAVETLRES